MLRPWSLKINLACRLAYSANYLGEIYSCRCQGHDWRQLYCSIYFGGVSFFKSCYTIIFYNHYDTVPADDTSHGQMILLHCRFIMGCIRGDTMTVRHTLRLTAVRKYSRARWFASQYLWWKGQKSRFDRLDKYSQASQNACEERICWSGSKAVVII